MRKVSVVINENQRYGESELESVFIAGRAFDTPSVGNVTARQIDITFLPKSGVEIPRMAKIEPYVTTEAGQTRKGVFFIDTRSLDVTSGWMTARGFDSALLTEQALAESEEEAIPTDTAGLMRLIASKIGVSIDSRTVMPSYELDQSEVDRRARYMTMRQVAGYVAGLYGGNWIITNAGALYLLPLAKSFANATAVAINASNAGGIYTSPALSAWSGVKYTHNGKVIGSAGDDSGRVMEIENPWGSDGIAAALLESIRNLIYYPYEVTDAVIDPAVEIGDFVSVDGAARRIFAMSGYLDGICAVDISAPADYDIDHEFPRSEALKKAEEQAVEDALDNFVEELKDPEREPGDNPLADNWDEYVESSIDGWTEDFIEALSDPEREPGDNPLADSWDEYVESSIDDWTEDFIEALNDPEREPGDNPLADQFDEYLQGEITLRGSTDIAGDGTVTDNVELTVGGVNRGTASFVRSGSISISGQLSADALYANYGDFANLTVDKLLTSRRIVKYLAGDTSDDNYQWISGEVHEFIAGLYNSAGGPNQNGEEQATNPNGELIYWSYDPNAEDVSIGANGYPYRGGVQIEITTAATQWPVMVYTYTEQVKGAFAFEEERAADAEAGTEAIYTPTITLGVGNAQGYNQGLIRKSTEGLEVAYSDNTGGVIGMRCRNDGYTEIAGFVKILESEDELPEGHENMDTLFIIAEAEE